MTRSHKIGCLVLVLAVLFMLWRLPRLHGQGFGSFSHDQPFLAADKATSSSPQFYPDVSTNYYWWIASNTAVGTVGGWTDKIRGAIWTNSVDARRPTNDTVGVYFDATNGSAYLSNSPGIPFYTGGSGTGGPVTIWWIGKLKPSAIRSTLVSGLADGELGECGLTVRTPAETRNLYWYCGYYALADITTLGDGNWHDVVATSPSAVPGPDQVIWYIDGISVWTNEALGTRISDAVVAKTLGNSPEGGTFWHGWLRDFAIHCLTNASPTFASNIHYYRTNTYGP